MANYNAAAWYGDTLASPNTGFNLGPFTINPMKKLMQVKSSIGVTFPGVVIGPNQEIAPIVAWGVQWGPQGYTPAVIPGQIGFFDYFWAENMAVDGWGSATWTPASNTAAYLGAGSAAEEWNGQLFANQSIDLYLSAAALVTGAPAFGLTYTINARYTY